jgi:uncharacterized membrane protein
VGLMRYEVWERWMIWEGVHEGVDEGRVMYRMPIHDLFHDIDMRISLLLISVTTPLDCLRISLFEGLLYDCSFSIWFCLLGFHNPEMKTQRWIFTEDEMLIWGYRAIKAY